MGDYTGISGVEALLQITITSSTKPTYTQVLQWITEVEDGVNARNLGSQTISGAIFDVPDWSSVVEGVTYVYPDNLSERERGVVVTPPYTPIISIASGFLYRNTQALDGTASWGLLKEGPGSDTDYVVIQKRNTKTGKFLGYAIYFYGDLPYVGYQRIRANITYGHNIDSDILNEYCSLQVARKVINARLFSAQPMNVATYTGGDMGSYTNTQYEVQMKWVDERIKEIETNYFPKSIPISVFRGM